jgi:hypothetical protein
MTQGFTSGSPIPTRIVSNEEFNPLPQTPEQARVECLIERAAEAASRRLGMSRRAFLRTSGGMATALLAMNTVFGKFFDVLEIEKVEAAAFAQGQGEPFFIFDVQTHYVSAHYDPADAEGKRKGAVTKQGLLALRKQTRACRGRTLSRRYSLIARPLSA